MARRKIPTQYRTLFPAAGQRGRSPEHAGARVLPVGFADALPTTFSFTQRTKHFSNPKSHSRVLSPVCTPFFLLVTLLKPLHIAKLK